MTWQTSPHTSTNTILHIDADAFFASCEQALNPAYRGKPVITGKERGIASAMSYEAKRVGVKRGMMLSDIKRVCPDAILLPSDYETYSLFSKRMFSIMRRYSGIVEEYSIDEAFVDVSGLRRPLNMSYDKMARCIKRDLEKELGISISIGIAPSKVLAKIGSNYNKPSGFTHITKRNAWEFLRHLSVEEIWGVGRNTGAYMQHLGIFTALDFANRPWEWVQENFTKPHQEIWQELNGEQVYAVIPEEKTTYASISKTKTFTPASKDKSFIYAQLMKNVENACIKARRHGLVANKVTVLLKTQDFRVTALEGSLSRASAYPNDLTAVIGPLFERLLMPHTPYRSSGVVLSGLQEDTSIQPSLFEPPIQIDKMQRVYGAVDTLANRFGKHTVHLGGSLHAHSGTQHRAGRDEPTYRDTHRLQGESGRKRLQIPLLSGTLRA